MITIERRDTDKYGQFLDITIDGVTVYGCQRKQGVGKKGPYDFIATPQRKGKDKAGADKWYDIVKFSDGVTAAIIAELDGGGSDGMDGPDYDGGEVPF